MSKHLHFRVVRHLDPAHDPTGSTQAAAEANPLAACESLGETGRKRGVVRRFAAGGWSGVTCPECLLLRYRFDLSPGDRVEGWVESGPFTGVFIGDKTGDWHTYLTVVRDDPVRGVLRINSSHYMGPESGSRYLRKLPEAMPVVLIKGKRWEINLGFSCAYPAGQPWFRVEFPNPVVLAAYLTAKLRCVGDEARSSTDADVIESVEKNYPLQLCA